MRHGMDNMDTPQSILWRAAACGSVGRPLSYVGYFAPLTDEVIAAFDKGQAKRKTDLDHIKAVRGESWSALCRRLSGSLYGDDR